MSAHCVPRRDHLPVTRSLLEAVIVGPGDNGACESENGAGFPQECHRMEKLVLTGDSVLFALAVYADAAVTPPAANSHAAVLPL